MIRILTIALISQLAAIAPALSTESVARNTSEALQCLDFGDNVRCFEAEAAAPWTVLIGIGSAKTGTTAMVQMLSHHNAVLIGNGQLGGAQCCYGETYFFSKPNDMIQGWDRYLQFFPRQRQTSKVLADKTPKYSKEEFTAYRAKLFLGRTKTKLVMTVRDRFERDVSEYFMRGIKRPYDEDLLERIEGFRKWSMCRSKVLSEVVGNNTHPHGDLFELISVEIAQIIARNIHQQCDHYHLGEIPLEAALYERNLYRWATLFGKENIICFDNDMIEADPEKLRARLETFLDIDPSGWGGPPPPSTRERSSLPQRMEFLFGDNATAMTAYLQDQFYSALDTFAPPSPAESMLYKELCL